MNMFNKILLSGLGALTVLSLANPAAAEDKKADAETSKANAILFRVENIKPIADKDGLINKCTFMVTAFNRLDKGVREAKLKFNWQDNIAAKYTIENKEIKVNTGKNATTNVSAEITLSDIAPHTQKSFEGSVDTDKCFLLFDNLNYTVDSCATEDDKVEMKNSKVVSKANSCGDKFDYIDFKNPEYYSEFKDVPESVMSKQIEDEKAKEVEKISNDYRDTMNNLKKVGNVLAEIK